MCTTLGGCSLWQVKIDLRTGASAGLKLAVRIIGMQFHQQACAR